MIENGGGGAVEEPARRNGPLPRTRHFVAASRAPRAHDRPASVRRFEGGNEDLGEEGIEISGGWSEDQGDAEPDEGLGE